MFGTLTGALTVFSMALSAGATKPCPESECAPRGSFEEAACAAAADWIVEGRIVNVVDHPSGDPVNKNFAEFTFEIQRWVKGRPEGAKSVPRQLRFRVGWCKNGRTLPAERNGRFRLWGKGSVTAAEPEYLWFEPVSK